MIEPEIELRLYGYISGIIKNNGGRMIEAGGDADHSHILASIGKIDISTLVGDIKRDSSSWIKKQGEQYQKFYWQRGFGAFSIGHSQIPDVRKYIKNQKRRHHASTFQDEFRTLCSKYDVEIDERYCWE